MGNRLMVQEGHLLAVFNSAHRVMKAESLLKARNMPILLIPAPRKLLTDCGLALRFTEDARESIMEVLEGEGLLPEFLTRFEAGKFVTIWSSPNH
jgi:hypothetical protein